MTPWIFIVPEWYLVTLSPQISSNSWGFFAVLMTHLLCHLYWTAHPLHFVSILPPLFIIHHDDTQNVLSFLIILVSEKSVKQCTFTGISPDIPKKIFCTLKWRNRLFLSFGNLFTEINESLWNYGKNVRNFGTVTGNSRELFHQDSGLCLQQSIPTSG